MKQSTMSKTNIAALSLALLSVIVPATLSAQALRPPQGVSEEEFKEALSHTRSMEIVYRAVYESVQPSVVQIVAQMMKKQQQSAMPDPFFFFGPNGKPLPPVAVRSEGSGFFIEPGIIVTNSHVVGTA